MKSGDVGRRALDDGQVVGVRRLIMDSRHQGTKSRGDVHRNADGARTTRPGSGCKRWSGLYSTKKQPPKTLS